MTMPIYHNHSIHGSRMYISPQTVHLIGNNIPLQNTTDLLKNTNSTLPITSYEHYRQRFKRWVVVDIKQLNTSITTNSIVSRTINALT